MAISLIWVAINLKKKIAYRDLSTTPSFIHLFFTGKLLFFTVYYTLLDKLVINSAGQPSSSVREKSKQSAFNSFLFISKKKMAIIQGF